MVSPALVNKVWEVDALRLLRLLPDCCENLVCITDPPYGVGYSYFIQSARNFALPYWTEDIDSANAYYHWFQPFYREIVRVTAIGSVLAFWQSLKYRQHYPSWYGQHSQLITIRFRKKYYPDLLLLQRKTRTGLQPVKLHANYVYHPYSKLDSICLRCAKTVAEVKEVIEHYTNERSIILDPFCGIGTTGVAAVLSGRRFILCEQASQPVRIARQRIKEASYD